MKLGWDVETAEDADLTGSINDVVWVVHAREQGRIGITFDELRAEQGVKVCHELRKRGGKIIRIQGGPEQDKYRSIGKLLFHYPDWYYFLSYNDGVSVISDIGKQNCRNCTPEKYHQTYHKTDAEQFEKYIESKKQRRLKRKKRKRKLPPPEQTSYLS